MKIVALHRFLVKSMIGEELSACHITEKGVYGDHMFGIINNESGKLANTKNPKK